MSTTRIPTQVFDAIVLGGGGAGLRAAVTLSQSKGYKTAVISKVFPTRSHTVSAQGGINAALANSDEDRPEWHAFDTVKGSDYLGDYDAINFMCQVAPTAVYELEHMGLPFSRMDNGRIYQRKFGGQSKNFGGEQAARTCAAADRTGHALLHTLFQQNLKLGTHFFNEWYAMDFVRGSQGEIAGVLAFNIENNEYVFFKSRVVILATGGAGRIFQSTTNALINTGDGMGMILRAGLPLQDMEMWQFHPTGIAGVGCLISEGTRGEGGRLINKEGEYFMERYAPSAKDLASRDVVSRAIALEIRAGRGFTDGKNHFVKLDLTKISADIIETRLPGIRELAMTFAHVDPIHEPIPVVPTCHYVMGGIPTNENGAVLAVNADGGDQVIPGLYAAGECACVSIHGANRLGGNSLIDLVVFGRAAGMHALEYLEQGAPEINVAQEDVEAAMQRVRRWNESKQGESVADIRFELQKVMQEDFGVFRSEEPMREGVEKLHKLRERLQHAHLSDKSNTFNTARVEALELDNLMAVACATAQSALTRQESRGAHSREDFPKRDDVNWLKHTLYLAENDTIKFRAVNRAPKHLKEFELKERVY
ncbi:MAG: succinate dehydrogenase flavoprotein subunit [Gammaproteobacteria bacterium]